MKKFLFSALTCVAFAGSGFASNEVVSEINYDVENVTEIDINSDEVLIPCTVQIDYVYQGKQYTYTAYADVANGAGCSDFLGMVQDKLRTQGYNINGYSAISGHYLSPSTGL